jgi:hypothetical protein
VCGRPNQESEFARFGNDLVCAPCKPVYVQRLREGVTPTLPRVRDLTALTRWLKGFLLAGIVATFVGLIESSVQLTQMLATGQSRSPDDFTLADAGMALFALLQVGAIAISAILLLRWIYLANSNVRILGANRLRFTPRGAIIWYFVPIFNLWKPYQAMKEIWRASMDPKNWPQVKPPRLLPHWWTLWILSSIFSNASLKAEIRASAYPDMLSASVVSILSDLIDIPLNFLAIALITRVWDAQRRHSAEDFADASS